MKINTLSIPIVLFAAACQDKSGEVNFEEGARQLGRVIDDATEGLREITPSRKQVETVAKDEVEKLYRVDYKVVRFDDTTSPDELEGALAVLGKEGWDCFHIWHHEGRLTFFCKKRPFSYFNYVPKAF